MTNNFIADGSYGKCIAITIFIFGILAFLFQTFNNNKGCTRPKGSIRSTSLVVFLDIGNRPEEVITLTGVFIFILVIILFSEIVHNFLLPSIYAPGIKTEEELKEAYLEKTISIPIEGNGAVGERSVLVKDGQGEFRRIIEKDSKIIGREVVRIYVPSGRLFIETRMGPWGPTISSTPVYDVHDIHSLNDYIAGTGLLVTFGSTRKMESGESVVKRVKDGCYLLLEYE